ncbi:MAG: VOC family protein [Phycisphaerales bacterium]|nr:VOC family protein [Phycisphaerales bacterium]
MTAPKCLTRRATPEAPVDRACSAFCGGPQFSFCPVISIAVLRGTREQVDERRDEPAATGGAPVASGWRSGRFSVSWQTGPKLPVGRIAGPDPIRIGRSMHGRMTPVNIDSEQLQLAMAE